MNKVYVKIEGIHCEHCKTTIKEELIKNKKVKKVEIEKDVASITYQGKLEKKEIIEAIKNIDYFTKEEYISDDIKKLDTNIKGKEFLIIFISILLIAISIKKIFGFNIFSVIPTIDSSITYGMLIVTGMLTSIHCISMCGAINLMATVTNDSKKDLKRPLLYNLGRVLSYTIIGGLAGMFGSILTINETVMGLVILLASLFMLLMSLSMLGIIKFKTPFSFRIKRKRKTKNAFLIGMLNGLMPCGPLQAMQIYALSTGSVVSGALSMFLFAIGTVPLMLMMGLVFNFVKGKRKILLNKIASVLIMLLSLVMFNRGLIALNIDLFKGISPYSNYIKAEIKDGVQWIEFDLAYDHFEDLLFQKGVPVKIVIHASAKNLTGCNNEIVIKEYGIEKKLEVGENVIEFTPTQEKTISYTCWMNMIKNKIKIIDDEAYFKEVSDE